MPLRALPRMPPMQAVDVLIRGDGAVGRALALALSHQGLRVALQGHQRPRAQDLRAYALNAASCDVLQTLRVWQALPPDAVTPVHDMRVQGDAGGRLDFSAWQAQQRELAHIVDAAALDEQLEAALRFAPALQRVSQPLPHTLLCLCEGREAGDLRPMGFAVQQQAYGHSALAGRLVSDTPHQGRAWQWFGAGAEVLALLPLDRPTPGHSYALVWSQPAERARERALAPEALAQALQQATQGAAGKLTMAGAAQTWPLALRQVQPWVRPGVALLGDCAHQVHPLAGQGLNLGLADVAALAQVLRTREPWRTLDDLRLLRRYERARALDTWAMARMTDGLWRGFA